MSKKIRVGWDDLKPGDLIHVKGSTNTYRFKSRTDWHSIHEETMTEEKTASFKYERCIIDLTEFSHKVSVEVRVYDTEETMRRAACIDLVESSIESDDLDRPIGDAAFGNGTAGITLMQSAPIDTQTNVVKYGNSPMCVIYLSREHLLPHIVSHECVHAAMGLYNAEILGYRHKAKARKHMTVSNELVAYVQSELFRCVMEFLANAVKTTEEEQ